MHLQQEFYLTFRVKCHQIALSSSGIMLIKEAEKLDHLSLSHLASCISK